MVDMLSIAYAYLAAGRSIIPIAPGCKRPSILNESWEVIDLPGTKYQHQRPSRDLVRQWFETNRPVGIGIIGGAVSGASQTLTLGLEFIDIDDPEVVPLFLEHANYHGLTELIKQLPFERTPKGGAHVGYLCPTWEGNRVLAQRMINGKPVTIIETRGSRGLCVVAPTPPGIHPSCPEKGYVLEHGSWTHIPVITKDERDVLLDVARGLTENVSTRSQLKPVLKGNRPGDMLNANADRVWWEQLLTKHGWKLIMAKGDVEYWQRPGKEGREWSATLGGCGQYLYVFSSNAWPFEQNRAYTAFAALTLLEHHGNYTQATHSLKGNAMAFQKQIGVLWLKEKKNDDGSKPGYMSGYIDNGIHGNIPIVIFRIRDKQNENGPDFRMILSQPAQQREEEEPPMQEEEDDIPF
jgi:hypothetical protein